MSMGKIKALSSAFMRRDRGILEIFARGRKKNISSTEDIILRLHVDMHGRARWHCTHDVTSQLDRRGRALDRTLWRCNDWLPYAATQRDCKLQAADGIDSN